MMEIWRIKSPKKKCFHVDIVIELKKENEREKRTKIKDFGSVYFWSGNVLMLAKFSISCEKWP